MHVCTFVCLSGADRGSGVAADHNNVKMFNMDTTS
jgi:hypothetical protein